MRPGQGHICRQDLQLRSLNNGPWGDKAKKDNCHTKDIFSHSMSQGSPQEQKQKSNTDYADYTDKCMLIFLFIWSVQSAIHRSEQLRNRLCVVIDQR